jgi:hypothetical protein
MSDPLVVAIMLTKDRSQMAARAVRAFREQTYENRLLLMFDTAAKRSPLADKFPGMMYWQHRPEWSTSAETIGNLRNVAIELTKSDILIHWDDDDVSHPNRIAEQVAHLQSSGADVVGYSELLFWREGKAQPHLDLSSANNGEAWLYKAPHGTAPGTSLCYKRSTWERKPFSDLPRIIAGKNVGDSEDVAWLRGLNLATVPSLYPNALCEPRLIASIHGGNTMPYDDLESSTSWRRTPQFDSFCRERMVL